MRLRKKCSRKQLLQFTANLKVELIGMEACGRSHLLGRALREQGHEVSLIPGSVCEAVVALH
jgi:transposase